jgi:hypothetical protein
VRERWEEEGVSVRKWGGRRLNESNGWKRGKRDEYGWKCN